MRGERTCEEFQCPSTENEVCGSDGKTYLNDCELLRKQKCEEGHSELTKAHHGECEPPVAPPNNNNGGRNNGRNNKKKRKDKSKHPPRNNRGN